MNKAIEYLKTSWENVLLYDWSFAFLDDFGETPVSILSDKCHLKEYFYEIICSLDSGVHYSYYVLIRK